MADVVPFRLPAKRIQLSCGWTAVRVRDNRRAPRYKAGEYVLFDGTRICGLAARDHIERLPEAQGRKR